MKKLKIGDKVIYKPKNEKGIVYSLRNKIAYVVYNCNNDWKNYRNYTPAGTHICDLKLGWEENKLKIINNDSQKLEDIRKSCNLLGKKL